MLDWTTPITELLRIRYPIIQGGLAYLAYSELAVAVSNAGGLGQITAMSLPDAETLRREIERVRARTDQPFGINFAIGMHGADYNDRLRVAIEERVPAVTVTGGNPVPLLEQLRRTDIKMLVLVASRRQAQKAEQHGASAVIVVGQEGGGHLGRDDVGTMVLVPQVADAVNIPVVASGGIGDGRGWMAAHALGAAGIEMGTRFIATRECVHASEAYQRAIIECSESDTAVIKRSIGYPARVLRSGYIDNLLKVEHETPTYEALKDLMNGEANRRFIHDGDSERGFGFAGQSAGMVDDVPTVAELFHRMVAEAEAVRNRWSS